MILTHHPSLEVKFGKHPSMGYTPEKPGGELQGDWCPSNFGARRRRNSSEEGSQKEMQ